MSNQDFIECMGNCSYSTDDVIKYTSVDGGNTYWYYDDWYDTKLLFMNNGDGIILSLEIKNDTVISNNIFSSATFILNKDLSYQIYIMDKRLQFITGSPKVIPRFAFSWNRRGGAIILYLNVIRHEKLNLPNKPCEPSPEYNLVSCLDRSLITRAGCQPYWSRVTLDDFPVCDNETLLDSFDIEYWKFYNADKNRLSKLSNCRMPCTFMEYKVSACSFTDLA